MFASIFAQDPNWRTLTERLPAVGVLEVGEQELERVLGKATQRPNDPTTQPPDHHPIRRLINEDCSFDEARKIQARP